MPFGIALHVTLDVNLNMLIQILLAFTPVDPDALRKQAEALRKEAADAELSLRPPAVEKARSLRIVLPMSKPDWTVVDEEVEFKPLVDGDLVRLDVDVPCGLLLEENDGYIVVAEVGDGSNAQKAGIEAGDVLRATSAVRMQMEMPTWQLIGGGIGRPRYFRFIFGCDLRTPPKRTFEEVLAAVASNRDDPQSRPALLVLERPPR